MREGTGIWDILGTGGEGVGIWESESE